MIQITENVQKIVCDSNIYIIKLNDEVIAIDAGNRDFIKEVKKQLKGIKVDKVLLTHLHYDHIGCLDLFKDAEVYASEEAIEDYNDNSSNTILNEDFIKEFNITLKPLKEIKGLKIIKTPGHSRGSVCFYLKQEQILFSGDTLFSKGHYGRTDLPTSTDDIEDSVTLLPDYKILCPGHDYDV